MKHKLLETRRGQPKAKSGLPLSLLSVSWSMKSGDVESGSKAGVVSVELGRPVKLSFSLPFLREVLDTLSELKSSVNVLLSASRREVEVSFKDDSEVDLTSEGSGSVRSPIEFGTPQSTREDLSLRQPTAEIESKLTELIVTTNQVIVEIILASLSSDCALQRPSSPAAGLERELSLQGEPASLGSDSTVKEGLVLAWQNLTLAVPPEDDLIQTSELGVDNLQLLSISDALSSDVVPPMHLSCLITRHKPCSRHDL